MRVADISWHRFLVAMIALAVAVAVASFIWWLFPTVIDPSGKAVQGWRQLALDDALAGARAALSAAGIDYALDAPPPRLPAEVEEVFAWAVREGTTNVVRHSRARRCAVRIHGGAGEAVVEVEDDGVSAPPDPDAGSGLSGLAERAAAVRGRLEAGAAPGGGFLLRLVVPLPS